MNRGENPQKEEYLWADVRKSLFFVFFSLNDFGAQEKAQESGGKNSATAPLF